MPTLDKKALSERDVCSKFITPALVSAKWDIYADTLDVPFVFSSNGDAFVFHDRTGRPTRWNWNWPSMLVHRPPNCGDAIASGRASLPRRFRWSSRTTTRPAWISSPVTTSKSPSIAPSRPSSKARSASCWSCPPAPARPTSPPRSSGVSGRRARRSASSSHRCAPRP